jgi:hypothetical protein
MASPNAAWILQANPREWDITRFLADVRSGRTSPETGWLAPTHSAEIEVGDRVFLWTTGSETDAGVVALGTVTARVADRPEDKPEYRMLGFEEKYGPPRPRIRIRIEAPLKFHLSRRTIRYANGLGDLSILRRRPQGTVFRVMPDEASTLERLCDARV